MPISFIAPCSFRRAWHPAHTGDSRTEASDLISGRMIPENQTFRLGAEHPVEWRAKGDQLFLPTVEMALRTDFDEFSSDERKASIRIVTAC